MIYPCKEITARMGSLFTCSDVNGHVRVRTPFLYPDGDVIDIFVRDDGNATLLTDLGETLRWLRGQSVSDRRSARQRQLIEDVRLTHGVELFRGELVTRVANGDDLVEPLVTLAQACIRTADVSFTSRTRIASTTVDEVAEFLDSKDIQFEREVPLIGRSGKHRTVDFKVRMPHQSSLIQVLSTGSRAATTQRIEHVVTTWVDLSHLTETEDPPQFVSLFDDTVDVWSPEDFKLASELSRAAFWANPESIGQALGIAV